MDFAKGTLAYYRDIAAEQTGQSSKSVEILDEYIATYGLDQQTSMNDQEMTFFIFNADHAAKDEERWANLNTELVRDDTLSPAELAAKEIFEEMVAYAVANRGRLHKLAFTFKLVRKVDDDIAMGLAWSMLIGEMCTEDPTFSDRISLVKTREVTSVLAAASSSPPVESFKN